MVYSKCHCSPTFCWTLTICSFSLGPIGKELPFGFPINAVLLNAVLIVCAPFPFGVWGTM